MRASNTLVIDQTINGTTPIVSSSEYNDLLGKGDDVILELEVTDGTATTITVEYMHSNSGLGFVLSEALWSATSLSSLPFRAVKGTTLPHAALGQVRVTLSNGVARVRVWACCRTH